MPERPEDLPDAPGDDGPTHARIRIDRARLGELLGSAPEAADLRRRLMSGDFGGGPPTLIPPETVMLRHTLNAEVVFEGVDGPPLKLMLWHDDPAEALQFVKEAVRQDLITRGAPGGSVYTVGIFPRSYRRGDESIVAERVSLVTMPHAPADLEEDQGQEPGAGA